MRPPHMEGSVAWLLEGLPPDQAQAFDLFVIHQESVADICQCMKLPRYKIYRLVRMAARNAHTYDLQKLLNRRLEVWEKCLAKRSRDLIG